MIKIGHQVRKTSQTQKNQYNKVDVARLNSTKINKDFTTSQNTVDWILMHPKSIYA